MPISTTCQHSAPWDAALDLQQRVTQLQKDARTEMLWLVVGCVPVGAVLSLAKAQKYRRTAAEMVGTLDRLKVRKGFEDPRVWARFGACYARLLELLNDPTFAAQVDPLRFKEFLTEAHSAIQRNDSAAVQRLTMAASASARAIPPTLRRHSLLPR